MTSDSVFGGSDGHVAVFEDHSMKPETPVTGTLSLLCVTVMSTIFKNVDGIVLHSVKIYSCGLIIQKKNTK